MKLLVRILTDFTWFFVVTRQADSKSAYYYALMMFGAYVTPIVYGPLLLLMLWTPPAIPNYREQNAFVFWAILATCCLLPYYLVPPSHISAQPYDVERAKTTWRTVIMVGSVGMFALIATILLPQIVYIMHVRL